MTDTPLAHRSIVLLAHGSRDPQWAAPIEAVASQIRARQPGMAVCCAYLELRSPTLPEATEALIAAGARQVKVFPLFLGVGKHVREDLPKLLTRLNTLHPDIAIELLPTAGEYELLTALLADIALS